MAERIPPGWEVHYEVLRDRLAEHFAATGKYRTPEAAKLAASSVAGKLVREAASLGIDPSEVDTEEVDPRAPLASWRKQVERFREPDYASRADLAKLILEKALQPLDLQIEILERAAAESRAARAILARRREEREALRRLILRELEKREPEEVEEELPRLRRLAELEARRISEEIAKKRRKAEKGLKRKGLKEW